MFRLVQAASFLPVESLLLLGCCFVHNGITQCSINDLSSNHVVMKVGASTAAPHALLRCSSTKLTSQPNSGLVDTDSLRAHEA